MSGATWGLWAAIAAVLLGAGFWLYRTREARGRGRAVLAVLHGLTIGLLVLLLFDPDVPVPGAESDAPHVLLDASLSMTLPHKEGGTRWERAVAEARSIAGEAPVVLFGAAPRAVPFDTLATISPAAPTSRLVPALQAASEAGAREVIVLTDGGIEDAAEAARWIPRLGLRVDYRVIADTVADRALVELRTPRWAEVDKPVEFTFGVAVARPVSDSIRVSVQKGDTVVARTAVAAPEPGRVATGALRFTPQSPGGTVRYDVRIEEPDAAPDNDVRTAYVLVSDRPTGVAVLTLRPDWEMRFLVPVIERALGVPVRGYVRTTGSTYLRMGSSLEAGSRADEDEVRRALDEAQLVVVHGLDPATPEWITDAVSRARRVLVLPKGAMPPILPVQPGRVVAGEWYAVTEVPPSPVAPALGGLDASQAPPLSALMPVDAGPGMWVPMLASRGRRGARAPLAVGGETGGRRWVLALGEGYWRWAFRGDASRQLYARFWSALAGWLVHEQGEVTTARVRPDDPVVPRGLPVRWVSPGLAADSIRIHIERADGAMAVDTVVTASSDSAATAGLTPGRYNYRATAFAGDSVAGTGEGEITAETYSPEYLRPLAMLVAFDAAGPSGAGRSVRGRPVHMTPWPYAMLITLLAALWILRRRWGLR
jgi:hypothetical protein